MPSAECGACPATKFVAASISFGGDPHESWFIVTDFSKIHPDLLEAGGFEV